MLAGEACLKCGQKHEKCHAHNKRGLPCKRDAIIGGTVCYNHGGHAPQTRRAATQRVHDAVQTLIPDDLKEKVLKAVSAISFSDIRQAFDEQGNLKPVHEWPDGLAPAVAGIDVVKRNLEGGDGHQDVVVKMRLWDKNRSVENLMKYLGMLKDKVDHQGTIEIKWLSDE